MFEYGTFSQMVSYFEKVGRVIWENERARCQVTCHKAVVEDSHRKCKTKELCNVSRVIDKQSVVGILSCEAFQAVECRVVETQQY
jgi:hypothetical protein